MTADRSIIAKILTLFLIIAVPVGLSFRKLPTPVRPSAEIDLAKFSSQPVSMSFPQPPAVFSGLACPVTPRQAIAEPPPPARVVKAAPTPLTVKNQPRSLGSSLPVVSVISYDGSTRTAIVGDRVVVEGSAIDGGTIVKIEENRVLMRKNGKNIWLTIE
jgi:hypothetical protein